jgi:hypothetical protein
LLGGPLCTKRTDTTICVNRQESKVVHDRKTKDEMIGSTRDTANAPAAPRRVRRRSFIFGHTAIAHPEIARDIEVRIDADFERIFGSE